MKRAVLFITFNRLDYVQETFEQIRIAKPPRFYIASDGPRENVEGEAEKIQAVRDYILNNIDWDCEVKTRFLEKNSGGCAYGVSGAVTWFFEQEKDGIVLEDDCVPSQSFFGYCEELLDRYKDDKRVWHISGTGQYKDDSATDTYYFTKIQHCWGWAGWADRWKHFKLDVTDYNLKDLKKLSDDVFVQEYWQKELKRVQDNKAFTWDYQWALIIVAKNGYCINPYKNMITNIGFIGEHFNGENPSLMAKRYEIEGKIKHPKKVEYNRKAVDFIYYKCFNIKKIYRHWYERIFSIRNTYTQKVLTILGIKIYLKRKNKKDNI